MKFNNKQKVALTAGIFAVILGGVGTLNFFKFRDRSRLFAEIERYEREEQLAREKIKRIPDLLENRSKLAATIDRYAEILPQEEHVQHEAFVNTIGGYSREAKILIQTAEYISLKEEKEGDGSNASFNRHRYRFKLLGTFPDFLNFIAKVENHTRFLKVDSIAIKPHGAPDGFADAGGARMVKDLLDKASNPVKEIELTLSTYTYFKGDQG